MRSIEELIEDWEDTLTAELAELKLGAADAKNLTNGLDAIERKITELRDEAILVEEAD